MNDINWILNNGKDGFVVSDFMCATNGFYGGLYQSLALAAVSEKQSVKPVTVNTQILKSVNVGASMDIRVSALGGSKIEHFGVMFYADGELASLSNVVCAQSNSSYEKQFSKAPQALDYSDCEEVNYFSSYLKEQSILNNVKTRWLPSKIEGLKDKVYWATYDKDKPGPHYLAPILLDASAGLIAFPFPIGTIGSTITMSTHFNEECESDWYLFSMEFLSANKNLCNVRNKMFSDSGLLVATSTFTLLPSI